MALNYFIKKNILLIIYLCLISYLFSKELNFCITHLAGFSISNVNEFVYSNDIKESELEWKNYKPFIGIGSSIQINNFSLDFSVISSIPVALGNTTDKDYFITESNDICMYSKHNLITDKSYSFEVNFSYKFIFSYVDLDFWVSGIYSNIKMEAIDGYLQYPTGNNIWTGKESKEYLNGTVITYEQARYLVGIQFGLLKKIRNFEFNLISYFYPITYVNCIDNHYLRTIQFLDYMKSGNAYRIKAKLLWKINEKVNLIFDTDFNYLHAQGYTYINSLGIITSNTTELGKTCSSATNYYDLGFSLCCLIKM